MAETLTLGARKGLTGNELRAAIKGQMKSKSSCITTPRPIRFAIQERRVLRNLLDIRDPAWCHGFIGARYAMPWAEPFTFLAVRFGIAFLILAGDRALRSAARAWRAATSACRCVAGMLMHGVYLGGVFWAVHEGTDGRPFGADRRFAAADHRACWPASSSARRSCRATGRDWRPASPAL